LSELQMTLVGEAERDDCIGQVLRIWNGNRLFANFFIFWMRGNGDRHERLNPVTCDHVGGYAYIEKRVGAQYMFISSK
jgi:hypothetical protein